MSLQSSSAQLLGIDDESNAPWDEETPFLSSLYYKGGGTLGGGGAVGVRGPYGRARRRFIAHAKARPKRRTRRAQRRSRLTTTRPVPSSDSPPPPISSSALCKEALQPLIKIAFESPYKEVRRDAAEAFLSLCEHRTSCCAVCVHEAGTSGPCLIRVPPPPVCVRTDLTITAVGYNKDVPMASTLDALLQLAAVSNPHNDVVIICRAATALASLVSIADIGLRLAESPDGISNCLQLLRISNSEANFQGSRILFRLAKLAETPAAIVDAGGMKALCSSINHKDKRIRKLALSTAVHLCTSVLHPERIGDTSTPFRMLEMFTVARHPEQRVGLLDLMTQLAAHSDVRPRLVAAGAVDTLANLLTSNTTTTVVQLVRACARVERGVVVSPLTPGHMCLPHQVVTFFYLLSLSPDVQSNIIQSTVPVLLLRVLFGDAKGSEDPIPKETTAGRITVVAVKSGQVSMGSLDASNGSRGGAVRAVQDKTPSRARQANHAPARATRQTSTAPSQFRHILTRAGAVMGGSTTSMGHDIPEDAPDPAGVVRASSRTSHASLTTRPRSRASSRSRPRSARSRPRSARSRPRSRPGSPRSRPRSRPGSALSSSPRPATPTASLSMRPASARSRRPGSAARARSPLHAARPTSRASVGSRSGRPSSRQSHRRPRSALSTSRGGEEPRRIGEDSDGMDGDIDRRVSFFKEHPLTEDVRGMPKLISTSTSVVIPPTDGFHGRLPELASTAHELQALLQQQSATADDATLPQALDSSMEGTVSGRQLEFTDAASPTRTDAAASARLRQPHMQVPHAPHTSPAPRTLASPRGSARGVRHRQPQAPAVEHHAGSALGTGQVTFRVSPTAATRTRTASQRAIRGNNDGHARFKGASLGGRKAAAEQASARRGSKAAANGKHRAKGAATKEKTADGARRRRRGADSKRRKRKQEEDPVSLAHVLGAYRHTVNGEKVAQLVNMVVAASRASQPGVSRHGAATAGPRRLFFPFADQDVLERCMDHLVRFAVLSSGRTACASCLLAVVPRLLATSRLHS